MTKNKIAFAGFMGAILVSVGAANAATTTVATKGYVDGIVGEKGSLTNTVKTLQEKTETLETNSITIEDVTNAINDLKLGETYEALANKVTAISSSMSPEDKATKYPTVGAVLDAMPTLTDADKQAIKDLTGENGLITRVGQVENKITTLNGDEETTGSVAQKIADALKDYTKSDDLPTYQAKSTADLQIGTTGGVFRDMTDDEKAALASGITSEKVAGYDELVGEDGTIAEIAGAVAGLETVVSGEDGESGLVKTVDDLEKAVNDTENGLAKKITMPAECESGNKVCVLMVTDGNISWTPVTSPVEDPVTSNEGE